MPHVARRRIVSRSLAAILPILVLGARPARAAIVVESLTSGGARDAGLAVGDVLTSWRSVAREGRSGSFARWSDLELLDLLESPHGPVAVTVLRDGAEHEIALPARQWNARARPAEPASTIAAATAAVARLKEDRDGAARSLRELAADADAETAAWLHASLARALAAAGDPAGAREAFTQAARLAAGPFAAELLQQAGDAAMRQRDVDGADTLYREALDLWNADERDGLGASLALNRLGTLHGAQFDLVEATRWTERACAIRRRRAPASWLEANCLNSLGILAGRRNDLAVAETAFLDGLAIYERLGMSGAPVLANLGIVARRRGDAERAEAYFRRAIALRREEGNLLSVGQLQINLGNALADVGKFSDALASYDDALALHRQFAPASDDLALVLLNRGKARRLGGDVEGALVDLEEARAIRDFEFASHPEDAAIVEELAEIALARGEPERAARLAAEALAVRSRALPDSSYEALAARLAAETRLALGDLDGAESNYRFAIDALEAQQRRIGGGDRGLAAFRSKFADIYRGYQELLVQRGRPRSACEVYERSRAQALLAMLGDRSLALDEIVPRELEQTRRRLRAEAEDAYRALSRLAADAGAEREKLRLRLESLHAEIDVTTTRIHQRSPRAAALEAPPVLTAASIQAGLDDDALLLAYSLGRSSATLFVVAGAGEVEAHLLDATGDELAAAVERWVELATAPRRSAELDALTNTLSETLLAPAAPRILAARRLVIVPDGALHHLSFAALREPGGRRYLVELAPIVVEVSGSVWASPTAHGGTPAATSAVIAFGDPAYEERATARSRRDFGRLPATRDEALSVGSAFGDAARIFLGAEATEETARRELPSARVSHFACHAAIDEQLPLDSALLLSPSADGAGLLQAWEILEGVRLDADLVVLSACETARGKLRGGEGSVGLVRSLRIAGARTVVASLWTVADESTAELMRRFYRRLAAGESPDAALRGAQLELSRGPIEVERGGRPVRIDATSPRNWAPFVVVGRAGE